MDTLAISAAKAHFSELVQSAQRTRQEYAITVNGAPAAVLVSHDEWESLHETLAWLSHPSIVDDVAAGRKAVEAGLGFDEAGLRAELGLPPV